MKSKIERSELDVLEDILQEVQENNEFMQELLADGEPQPQPQTEEKKELHHHFDKSFYCVRCGLEISEYWKPCEKKIKDTPEEWEEELMEIIGEATDLDEITDFIKQLLEERVENVLEQIQDWLSSDKGGDMDDEYLNILIDDIEELKLNTKKK